MIKRISINNFRTISELELNDIKRISLISGRNNVGKSTILEALFLFMDHNSPDSFMKLCNLRGMVGSGEAYLWEPVFRNMDTDNVVKIAVVGKENAVLSYEKDTNYIPNNRDGIAEETLAQFRNSVKNSYSLKFGFEAGQYHEDGHFSLNGTGVLREIRTSLPGNEILRLKPTRYLNAFFARFDNSILNDIGALELKGEKKTIIDILKLMDPGIEDIITVSIQGITQLYLRVNGKLIPLQYAGDGIIKLLNISLAIMENRNGLVLIDEMETGLHYSTYGDLWRVIDHISKESNCQVIATTHSYELISSVKENIEHTDDFVYYRLGKEKESMQAYGFDYATLSHALGTEMEVR